jgi:hypothetical protein
VSNLWLKTDVDSGNHTAITTGGIRGWKSVTATSRTVGSTPEINKIAGIFCRATISQDP